MLNIFLVLSASVSVSRKKVGWLGLVRALQVHIFVLLRPVVVWMFQTPFVFSSSPFFNEFPAGFSSTLFVQDFGLNTTNASRLRHVFLFCLFVFDAWLHASTLREVSFQACKSPR